MQKPRGFHFGIEAEYLLIDAHSYQPLWFHDLSFSMLNELLESISLDGLPDISHLSLEPPHHKRMPYVVEGYHLPDQQFRMIDMQPKGIEIRTPVCDSIEGTLATLSILYGRLQKALSERGCRAVVLSHHPTATTFSGPQNKRRHDYWQWAMEAMTTYGPDINISLPLDRGEVDIHDLHAKINYYAPAMTALTVASPIFNSGLWKMRGTIGKSVRTYRRSIVAPGMEYHPDQNFRIEFKLFEMTPSLADFHACILLVLVLLLDSELEGRASDPDRIYDLGSVARFGLNAETVDERLTELFSNADRVLLEEGFDPTPLSVFRKRWEERITPADEIIRLYQADPSIPALMRKLMGLERMEYNAATGMNIRLAG